ncbi:DNA-binding response regulator [bacterium D16-51]|nr:DNA-binding response regulator [bacterium D16-59]RKI58039.1 DNA-binding response regulator [bacterium D16-51]
MEACVLVWEDDIGWCEQIKKGLANEGIMMQEADNLEVLLEGVQKKKYLAAVLSLEQLAEEAEGQDWEKGLSEICRKSRIPILFVSEREEYELDALNAGAEDYISKEKDIRILVARLKKSFMKKKWQGKSNTDYSDIYERFSERQVQVGAEEIYLTPKEAAVFHCFLHSRGEIISREEILAAAWGKQMPECRRVVDTVVKQLRQKMKETNYNIKSNYKLGYFLEKR